MEESWQLPSSLDRIRVNVALTILTERYDPDAAREVITAFRDLPAEEKYPIGYSVISTEEGDGEHTARAINGPRHLARIGSFRVFRIDRGCDHLPRIVIRPFWTNDLGTAVDERPDEFHLTYRSVGQIPIALDRYRWRMKEPSLFDRLDCLLRFHNFAPVTVWCLVPAETVFVADGYARN